MTDRLRLARYSQCLLQIPGVCRGAVDRDTVVACHRNAISAGKGMGIKADDEHTIFACARCHAWLDTGKASAEEKEREFDRALAHTDMLVRHIKTGDQSD